MYDQFLPTLNGSNLSNNLSNKPKLSVWNKTFQNVKCALASAALLHQPRQHEPLTLSVDAMNTAVGGILEQLLDDQSHQLHKTKTKYSAFDCKLLVMH